MKNFIVWSFFLYSTGISLTIRAQGQPTMADTLNNCKIGLKLLEEHQYEKAVESFNLCYRADQQNINYLEKTAFCYFQLGRLNEAKKGYKAIIELDSVHTTALNQLGSIYAKEGRYQKSLEQYFKLITLDSTNSFYHKKAANLFDEQGETDKAILYFQKALQLNPQEITILIRLAKIYENLNLPDQAGSLIAKGLVLDPTNPRLLFLKAKVDYTRKNYKGVVESIQDLLQYQSDTTAGMMQMLGIAHYHLQNFEKSIVLLEQLVQMGKETEFVHYYLGLAFRSAGEPEKSAYHFEEAVRNGISENISTYYTNLGISYEELQNYGESIKAYQLAYKNSRDAKILYHLARNYDVYYSEKKTALLYYEKFLTRNDTGNVQLNDYSKRRISELKEFIHLNIDTLQ